MQILFTKMQALGNDFVVINNIVDNLSLSSEDASRIADRHFGVGCDQILVLQRPSQELTGVDFFYQIFNADGSEAGQCVNGVRCLHQFVNLNGISDKETLTFATKDTQTTTFLNEFDEVSAIIQAPSFEPVQIPLNISKQSLYYNIQSKNGDELKIGAVSVGNPHAVIIVENIDEILIEDLGDLVSNNNIFPEKANVNFVQISDNNCIKLRSYELGTGETLACGSGAAASVVMGKLWGFLDARVVVELPEGDLVVEWSEPNNQIIITGAAELVFVGEITL